MDDTRATPPQAKTSPPATTPPLVAWPLVISPRLMAAYRIQDAGTCHLRALTRDGEGRVRYRYAIEDAGGLLLEDGDDLRSGAGARVDYAATMSSLLSFLEHAAETTNSASSAGPGGRDSRIGREPFSRAVMEWAGQHSDELATARADLDQDASLAATRQVFLDLSTRHLPQQELQRLRDWADECPARVIAHEYGAWVNVPPADRGQNSGAHADPLADIDGRWAGFPHLRDVLRQARRAGAWWINLDAGSEGLIPHLPVFPWEPPSDAKRTPDRRSRNHYPKGEIMNYDRTQPILDLPTGQLTTPASTLLGEQASDLSRLRARVAELEEFVGGIAAVIKEGELPGRPGEDPCDLARDAGAGGDIDRAEAAEGKEWENDDAFETLHELISGARQLILPADYMDADQKTDPSIPASSQTSQTG